MTYLEKFRKDHPGIREDQMRIVPEMGCPMLRGPHLDYPPCMKTPKPKEAYPYQLCHACWDQEIPDQTSQSAKGGSMIERSK